ncbi:hypothetical protein [Serratia fonticola]|uniref:Uncharacterized protein n=1 Tax=Serratia fonticola TaxID=47917 RepID=A0AAW3WRM2_SERFO|nr:hypothetical protein [Serratia fonticola]MBC3213400.1 hypothetical protein [Serratia fonticola]NYA14259.1 hypothetical protein [Serratia fonticola]NYA33901.1 hypothetical protein [Serratia fonticola]
MPIYPTPDSYANNFTAPQAPGWDTPPTPGVNPAPAEEGPSVLGAAFRQYNLMAGLFNPAPDFEEQEGYNPFTDPAETRGYEPWATAFSDSRSPQQTASIKQRIDGENQDRQFLAESGAPGVLASIAAGVVDPVTIASLFVPGAQGGLVARVASNAAIAAGGTAISELALHQQQYTRTAEESLFHTAAGAVLGGMLGAGSHLLSPEVRNAAQTEIADSLRNLNTGGSVGAMNVPATTLAQETMRGPKVVNKVMNMTPLGRTMDSPSVTVRRTVQQLAENNLTTAKNLEGIATPSAAETQVRMWAREEAASAITANDGFAKFRAQGGTGSKLDFAEEVGRAMRRNDTSPNAVVQETAKALRPILDNIRTEMQSLGILADNIKVTGALSYFPRMYRQGEVIARRDEFRKIITDWWARGSKASQEDLDIAADEVINKIIGAMRPQDYANAFSVKLPGAAKSRSLNVPDDLLEPYLESDVRFVMQRHIRDAAPNIELTRNFGDSSMERVLKDIRDEYTEMMRNNPADQVMLNKRMQRDETDIMAMRDRLLGTYKMPDNPSATFVRAGNVLRNMNYLTKLGGMTVSAVPDLARAVMVNGFAKTFSAYGKWLARSPAWKANKQEMRKMGTALDIVLSDRSRAIADIADGFSQRSALESGLDYATGKFGNLTLMNQWNSFHKSLNGMNTADLILSATKSNARLAKLGIDDNMAARIQQQFNKHGKTVDGLRIGNSSAWDDPAVRAAFESAVVKDVNNTIVTPGIGDTPLWSSSQMGKLVFQFKSFIFGSYNRATAGGIQAGDAQFYYGLAMQLMLGAMTYAIKNTIAGRDVDYAPEKLVLEGVDRSGVLGPLMEFNNTLEKVSAGTLGFGPALGTGTQSRYASRNAIGSILGPSFDSMGKLSDIATGILSGDFDDKAVNSTRQLIPGQNLFWIAPTLNKVEEQLK